MLNLSNLTKIRLWLQKELAQLTCECERHIGTQSGGMDQVLKIMIYFAIDRLNMEKQNKKGLSKHFFFSFFFFFFFKNTFVISE